MVSALKELGFESFIGDIEEVLKEHKTQQKDRERKMTRMEDSGLSAEELQRQQELLFAASAHFEIVGHSSYLINLALLREM